MKIGLFSYAFPYPNPGFNPGIETVIYNLAKNLSKYADVTVYTSFANGGIEKENLDDYRILRTKELPFSIGNLGHLYHSWKIIKKYRNEIEKEDILHDIGSMSPFWFKSFKAPSLTTFHHFEPPKTIGDYLANFPVQLLMQKESKADVIVAVSEFGKLDFLTSYSIKNKKVVVIPNGIDSQIFNSDDKSKLVRENTLFYAGVLIPRKGLINLIKALPQVVKEFNDLRVLIAGNGPQKKELLAYSKKLGVYDNISFSGFIPIEELPKYYMSATAFIFPTLKEGFGMVALESMGCGTPVIASNIEPVKSIVGDTGLFFEKENHISLAEQIITFLSDKNLQIRLSKKAAERAKKFSWDKIALQYMDLYSSLLYNKYMKL